MGAGMANLKPSLANLMVWEPRDCPVTAKRIGNCGVTKKKLSLELRFGHSA